MGWLLPRDAEYGLIHMADVSSHLRTTEPYASDLLELRLQVWH